MPDRGRRYVADITRWFSKHKGDTHMPLKIDQPAEESQRQQAYALLKRQISDQTMHAYFPAQLPNGQETQLEFFTANRDGKLVGAAYVGPDWADLTGGQRLGWSVDTLDDYRDHILYLHGIATQDDAAGQGVGRALMQAVEAYAHVRNCRVIIGVTDTASAGFYARHGFHLLGPEVTIAIPVDPGIVICWPIEGSSQWFAKPLVAGSIGKIPPGSTHAVPLWPDGSTTWRKPARSTPAGNPRR